MTVKEVNMEWCAKQTPARLSFLGTSLIDASKALQATFGAFPIQLNRFEHEQSLLAMYHGSGELDCYKQLLEALRAYNEIEIRII